MDIRIEGIDQNFAEKAVRRQRQLAKPYGALGILESIATRVAAIRRTLFPRLKGGMGLVVFAADHGVFEEGVTSISQEMTALYAGNIAEGRDSISVLCQQADTKVTVVDMGMVHNASYATIHIRDKSIRQGSANIAHGPAMSEEECHQAMRTGAQLAENCVAQGLVMLGGIDIGVGNSTIAGAVLSVLLGEAPEDMVNVCAETSREELPAKISAVYRALENNTCTANEPFEVLRCLGGFSMAALVGFYIRAAQLRCVVMLDGYVNVVAALVACRLAPQLKGYLLLSHRNDEKGFDLAMQEMQLEPIFDFGMLLDVGVSCPLAFNMVEAAVRALRDTATYEELSIENAAFVNRWRYYNEHTSNEE